MYTLTGSEILDSQDFSTTSGFFAKLSLMLFLKQIGKMHLFCLLKILLKK